MSLVERLDPKNDLVFKLLLSSNEDILIALLSAILRPPVPIRRALVQNPELPRSFPDDKGSLLDVYVQLDDGARIDVEMQCAQLRSFRGRALYYWSQLFSSQLEIGQDHSQLAPVFSVLLLDYREFPFRRYHEIFRLSGAETRATFSSLLEIHTIELPKLPVDDTEDPVVRWGRFFSSKDPRELKRLTEEDPMIQKAEEKLFELSADEKLRQQVLERKRHEVSHRLELGYLRREAQQEGRQEGRLEGRLEGRQEGRLEGERLVVQRLLIQKFGELPQAFEVRLENSTEDELQLWIERVLRATTLDEVFAPG